MAHLFSLSYKVLLFVSVCGGLIWKVRCNDMDHLSGSIELLRQAEQFIEENEARVVDSLTAKLKEATCPPDSVPFYFRNMPKPCSTKHPRPCLLKRFSCHEDHIANVSICCGKVEGCRHGQPQINNATNRAVVCYLSTNKSDVGNQCQPQFECQERRPGARLGFCCPPAPTMDNTSRCCGTDQNDGCPDGFKPMQANGQKILCSPETSTYQVCPPEAICHWSSSTSRYHCCEVDNGCPDGAAPVSDPNGPRKCSNSSQCPEDSSCEHSSWRNKSQCCKNMTISGRCPDGYTSAEEAKVLNISASGLGTCDGKMHAQGCTAPAICLRAVDALRARHLCCVPTPQCLYSSQSPYIDHGKPRICTNSTAQTQCPVGYRCEESTVPSVYICCSSVNRMAQATGPFGVPTVVPSVALQGLTCPAKFQVQKEGAIICDPQVTTSCNAGSRCLPANKPGYFVCCTPISPISSAKCTPEGVFIWSETGGPQPCNPNFIFTGCPQTHPLCLFYSPIGRHSCCSAPTCPNGNEPLWTLGTTVPRHCGNVESGDCPLGYQCLYSIIFNANVCCLSRFRVPNPIGASRHLSPTYNGGIQERRRSISLNRWSQFDGDMKWSVLIK